MSSFMNNRHVDKNLQLKVMKYLDYAHIKEEEDHLRAEKILSIISPNLREDIFK